MINLVILDLDGTLLTDEKRVTQNTLAAIDKYHKKGVQFAVCTGRSMIEATHISEISEVFSYCDYVITSGGGSIASLKDFKRLYTFNIARDKVKQIYNSIKDKENMFEVFVDDKAFCPSDALVDYKEYIHQAFFTLIKETSVPVKDMSKFLDESKGNITMLFISFKNQKTRDEAYEIISKLDGIKAHLSWTQAIEVVLEGVDKGESVKKLAEIINVKKENIMCMGDSYNDIPMRKACDTLVAMGNGIDELKNIADFVTLTNNEGGIEHALEKFLN
ncbi:MAG: HAD family phosphatase [Peptostreptococcaceae bacterium]|nr:HAD family phosphatase [Peptostreptococcaceae bacterium]